MTNGIVGLVGLVLMSLGAGWMHSWPAGLIVLGVGLYLDSMIKIRA